MHIQYLTMDAECSIEATLLVALQDKMVGLWLQIFSKTSLHCVKNMPMHGHPIVQPKLLRIGYKVQEKGFAKNVETIQISAAVMVYISCTSIYIFILYLYLLLFYYILFIFIYIRRMANYCNLFCLRYNKRETDHALTCT
jgi:hypothetical protein